MGHDKNEFNIEDYEAAKPDPRKAAAEVAKVWKKNRRQNFPAYARYRVSVIDDHVKMKLLIAQIVEKYFAHRHTDEKFRAELLDHFHTLRYLKYLRKFLK